MTSSEDQGGKLVGYARVSSTDQNLVLQLDALQKAGCAKVFEDRASGAKADRLGLEQALDYLRPGDTFVVWRLDRLGRSLKHLIEVVSELEAQGIGFRSLQESIDTTTSGGRLVFHIFSALAEFERNLIRERTMAGLAAARARGRMGGRPRKLSSKQEQLMFQLYDARERTVAEICETFGLSRSGFYKYLKRRQSPPDETS
jgi:DNA invertase Pin-like site-specific DNA recombinase